MTLACWGFMAFIFVAPLGAASNEGNLVRVFVENNETKEACEAKRERYKAAGYRVPAKCHNYCGEEPK